MAPQVGLEPTTTRLTAECSAIELLRIIESGSDLLSRAVSSQVPSARRGLTSVFGMGTGGSLLPLPPEISRALSLAVRSTRFHIGAHSALRFRFVVCSAIHAFTFASRFMLPHLRCVSAFTLASRFTNRRMLCASATTLSRLPTRACLCGLHATFRLHGLRFRVCRLASGHLHPPLRTPLRFRSPALTTAQLKLTSERLYSISRFFLRLSPRPISISNLHALRHFQR